MRLFWYSSVILLIRYFVLINGIPSAIISTLNGLDEQASGIPTSDSPFSWRVANAGCTNNYPIINQAITSGSRGVCLDSIVGSNAYYQVYLGALYTISSVVIQGRNNINQFVKSYNLEYSLDGVTFISDGINNPLTGNTDSSDSLATTSFTNSIEARFLRWLPITFNWYKSFRIEAYGEFVSGWNPAIISQLNGLDQTPSAIPTPDSPFSWSVANSGCTNNYPIIKQATRGVCLDKIAGSNAYYQVYLGAIYKITTVAIQSRGDAAYADQFVTSYNLEYSLDGITFVDNGINNPVTGNINRYSLVFTVLDINTRFLRWIPITFNGYKSFKIEAYGEFIDTISPSPSPTVPTTSPTYPVASTFPPEERCQSNEI
eukprot:964428_1